MRQTPVCPACGGDSHSPVGWGLVCKACKLEWHWSWEFGIETFSLPENRYEIMGGWSHVPEWCLPIIREERVR